MTAPDFLTWALETAIAVSALVLVILLIRRPVARWLGPDAAYLLWAAPLVRLFTPELSILPTDAAAAFPIAQAEAVVYQAAASTLTPTPDTGALFGAVAALWAIGALVFLAHEGIAQARFQSKIARTARTPLPATLSLVADLAAETGLRRVPATLVAAGDAGPLVAGVRRPLIILPAGFERDYTPAERRLALSHELCHIKRGDMIATLGAIVFRAFFWPNPLAYVAFRAFRADQEAACDADVLARAGNRGGVAYEYGATLVKAARARLAAPASSLAMSNHLKERLMMLKNPSPIGARAARLCAASLVVAGLALSASYTYAADKTDGRRNESEVRIITIDGKEKMAIEGVKNPAKIEIRKINGAKTVRIWDRKGKLLREDTYGENDPTPYDTVVVTDAQGKVETIDMTKRPEPPLPPDAPDWSSLEGEDVYTFVDDDAEGGKSGRKVVIYRANGDNAQKADCGDGAEVEVLEIESPDGKDARKEIICIRTDGDNSAKARADALRRTIAKLEADRAAEKARSERAISRLREELAKADAEAAQAAAKK